jgi:glutaredoxin-related protein
LTSIATDDPPRGQWGASGTVAGSFALPDRKPDRAKLGTMETPEITAYLKTSCGWSAGVRAVLAKYNLTYTEKDIIQNPAFRWEMETKSGQPLSPCVEINGKMLADVSGEEVETYMIDNKIVQSSDTDAGVPLNAPCSTEQHDSAVKLRL